MQACGWSCGTSRRKMLRCRMNGLYFSGFIVFLTVFSGVSALNSEQNKEFASNFGETLAGKIEKFSGYSVMQTTYETREIRKEFNLDGSKDGKAMIQDMANKLYRMLNKKRNAVQHMMRTLERKSRSFNWTQIDDQFSYYNVEFLNKNKDDVEAEYESQRKALDLNPDSRFLNRPVNLNKSVVQVPFDVYSRGKAMMPYVEWSKVLDEVFKINVKNDPTLKWQFFGSTQGFLRFYPAYQWKMETKFERPNVYDCRNRNWYTKAATFPKDMIILVDASGSMKGLKMSIAAHVVKTLLETLGDNDFFNVLNYSNEVSSVEPCFEGTLVRADESNKKRVDEAFRHSETKDVANLSKALEYSFEVMLKFHNSGSGGDCYSSIMIITDGATNSYQEVMDRFMNTTDRRIRIFSYLIGADKAYLKPVRDIACNNKGFFQQVESKNDVSEKVLHYLTVMNRPQAIKEDHHTIWTKPYYDETYLDHGFGLVTTVATPVYLHRSFNDPRMLGVAGTDVPVSLMLDSMNIHSVGVNGYVFIVTNNGYVAAHPRLETFFQTTFHDKMIKPNYNSIDIDDLEGNAVNDTIREALLNGEFGLTDYRTVDIPLDNWKRSISVRGRYYFTPVNDTPFTLGMFLPAKYGETRINMADSLTLKRYVGIYSDKKCDQINRKLRQKYPNKEVASREAAICSLNVSDITLPEDWVYCTIKNTSAATFPNGKVMTQLDIIKYYFYVDEDGLSCDRKLLNLLLFDVYTTAEVVPYWADHLKYENASSSGIVTVFTMTSSGMMRQFWHMDVSMGYSNLKKMLNGFDRQSFPSFYRRATSYSDEEAFIYTMLDGSTDLLISKALKRNGVVLGVAGAVMQSRYFTKHFWDTINTSTSTDCSQANGSQYTCYVIDDNGIVILSSTDSTDVGRSIGLVDGQVTRHLLSSGIFQMKYLYERGTICLVSEAGNAGGGSSSRLLNNPFSSVLSYATFWTKELALILSKFVIWNLWSLIFASSGTDATFSTYMENKDHYKVCDIRYDILTVNLLGKTPYENVTECWDECGREVALQKISQSNLYLLVVEDLMATDCDCSNLTDPMVLKNEQIKYSPQETCERLRDHKLGRKADGCDSEHKTKGTMDSELSELECENSAGTSLHRVRWLKTSPKTKGGSVTYSYLALSLSWFFPYILVNILNLTENSHLLPFM